MDAVRRMVRPWVVVAVMTVLFGFGWARVNESADPPRALAFEPVASEPARATAVHIPTIEPAIERASEPKRTGIGRPELSSAKGILAPSESPRVDVAPCAFEDFDPSTLPAGWNRVTFEVVDHAGNPQTDCPVTVIAAVRARATTNASGLATVTIPKRHALMIPTVGAFAWAGSVSGRPLTFTEWRADRPIRLTIRPRRTVRLEFRDRSGSPLRGIRAVTLSSGPWWGARYRAVSGGGVEFSLPVGQAYTIETQPHPVVPASRVLPGVGRGEGTLTYAVYCSLAHSVLRARIVDVAGNPMRRGTQVRFAIRSSSGSSRWRSLRAGRRREPECECRIALQRVEPGAYTIRAMVRRDARLWATADVPIVVTSEHAVQDVGDLVVTPTVPIASGHVVRTDGGPLARVRVVSDQPGERARTDDTGRFTLWGAATTRHATVTVSHRDFVATELPRRAIPQHGLRIALTPLPIFEMK